MLKGCEATLDFYAPLIQRERERKFDPLGEITYDIENVEHGYIHVRGIVAELLQIDFCLIQTWLKFQYIYVCVYVYVPRYILLTRRLFLIQYLYIIQFLEFSLKV